MNECKTRSSEETSVSCRTICDATNSTKGQRNPETKGNPSRLFVVSHSDVLGRYLEASQDIQSGQLLHRETPTAVGPQPGSPITCLGCLRRLSGGDQLYKCPDCNVAPFCRLECTTKEKHDGRECAITSWLRRKNGAAENVVLQPQTVLPLRCFLLQWTDPEKWRALMELEGHIEERKGTAVWRSVHESVVLVLQHIGIISIDDHDTIQKICSILDVNSFEVRGMDGDPLRAIYPTAALLAHDCIASACIAHEPEDMALVVRAAFDLKAGDLVTHNYAGTLLPTIERRENLRKGKYFECTCRRCRDPSEMGTNLGSLKCCSCGEGPVVSKDPLDRLSDWRCGCCGYEISGSLAEVTHAVARNQLAESNQRDEESMELLLEKLRQSFYPGHAILLEVGQILAGLYNEHSTEWIMSFRPNYALQRRWQLCGDLLEALNKLEPGISRMKGVCMYEMAVSATALASKGREGADIDSKDVAVILRESESLLRGSIANLLFEPAGSPEQKLIYSVFRTLRRVKELLGGT